MQTKKETVLQQLLQSGMGRFLEDGFEKASLRAIVKDAGTTIGNFYNYFDSKEELFDNLVSETYGTFMAFLDNHEEDQSINTMTIGQDSETLAGGIAIFIERMEPIFNEALLLLVDGSEGTKYEGFKERLGEFFTEHYMDHLEREGISDTYGYGIVAGNMFVDGLVKLIRTDRSKRDFKELLERHFMFFIFGTVGLLNLERGSEHGIG